MNKPGFTTKNWLPLGKEYVAGVNLVFTRDFETSSARLNPKKQGVPE